MHRIRLIHGHAAEAEERGASSRLAGYSGTPLPKKLGIKPKALVALAGDETWSGLLFARRVSR